jgi:hypothetical protein
MPGDAQDTFVALSGEKEDLVSTEEHNRTVLTDAIAEHLPKDYLRFEEPTNQGGAVPIRQWFDLDEGDALDWAA